MRPEPIKPVCCRVGSPLWDGFPSGEGIRCSKTAPCHVVHLPSWRHCSPVAVLSSPNQGCASQPAAPIPNLLQMFITVQQRANAQTLGCAPLPTPTSAKSFQGHTHASFTFQTKSFTEDGREGKAMGRISMSCNWFTGYVMEDPAPSLHTGRTGQILPQTWIC